MLLVYAGLVLLMVVSVVQTVVLLRLLRQERSRSGTCDQPTEPYDAPKARVIHLTPERERQLADRMDRTNE